MESLGRRNEKWRHRKGYFCDFYFFFFILICDDELTNEICRAFSEWLKFTSEASRLVWCHGGGRRAAPDMYAGGGGQRSCGEQWAAPRILLTGCILPGFRLSLRWNVITVTPFISFLLHSTADFYFLSSIAHLNSNQSSFILKRC